MNAMKAGHFDGISNNGHLSLKGQFIGDATVICNSLFINTPVIISGSKSLWFCKSSLFLDFGTYFTAQTSWHIEKIRSICQDEIDRWTRFNHKTIMAAIYSTILGYLITINLIRAMAHKLWSSSTLWIITLWGPSEKSTSEMDFYAKSPLPSNSKNMQL